MICSLLAVATVAATLDLDVLCRRAFEATAAALPAEKLAATDVSITVMHRSGPDSPWVKGSYQGASPMFPASVVKLFWLAYLAYLVEQGRVKLTPEIERAARDMIVVSSNDGTGAIVNLTTGALPGPELSGAAYTRWVSQRMSANRWFASRGYEQINVLNRTYNEGPYGREWQIIQDKGRNALTSDASARLMQEIVTGTMVRPRKEWMMAWLKRDIPAENLKADDQSFGFLGEVMPRGTRHWSKAGWTSQVRHDVSYNIMPDGREFVFCIFTKRPNNKAVLQTAAAELLKGLGYVPNPPRTGPGSEND